MAALENVLVWADRVLLPAISSEGFVCVLFCFVFCFFVCLVCFYFLSHCMTNTPMILALFLCWPLKSSKSSTERLIVDFLRSACLHGECMTAKIKTLAKITFQWSSLSSLHAPSGNSLSFILWYTDPSGCILLHVCITKPWTFSWNDLIG